MKLAPTLSALALAACGGGTPATTTAPAAPPDAAPPDASWAAVTTYYLGEVRVTDGEGRGILEPRTILLERTLDPAAGTIVERALVEPAVEPELTEARTTDVPGRFVLGARDGTMLCEGRPWAWTHCEATVTWGEIVTDLTETGLTRRTEVHGEGGVQQVHEAALTAVTEHDFVAEWLSATGRER